MSTVEPGTLCSHPPGERIIYCTVCKPSSTVLKRRVDELKTLLEAKDMRIAKLEADLLREKEAIKKWVPKREAKIESLLTRSDIEDGISDYWVKNYGEDICAADIMLHIVEYARTRGSGDD